MTRALVELMGRKFNIPAYQRGYRWEEQEVTELLDDIWRFCVDRESGDFYCLQPIVLQENEKGGFNVLDGQQRLTTIYILLVYLEDKRLEDGYNQPLFSLNYSTREKCEEFLNGKKFMDSHMEKSNIDFYHICRAYRSIETWFQDERHRGAKSKLVPILLDETSTNSREKKRNIRFIWYLVEKNPIDVFIRLNVGKIPLTDAELTKALLLQSDKYSDNELIYNKLKLYNIAKEWDDIEYALNEDDFWFFLNESLNEKPTRIEFIFDLLAERILKEKMYFKRKPIKHSTFLIFSSYLDDLIDNGIDSNRLTRIEAVETIWQKVIEYFDCFIEWFNNRELYHLIGYILCFQRENKNNYFYALVEQFQKLTKIEFKIYLENEIAKIIMVQKPIVKLVYENEISNIADQRQIRNLLLLHNVYSSWKCDKEKSHFPFNLYKKGGKWSLEHIWAQNSQSITKKEDQTSWLNDHISALSKLSNNDSKVIDSLKFIRDNFDRNQEDFDEIQNEVYSLLNKGIEDDYETKHSIDNLCLLDATTNSCLNNSVFMVKRDKIRERELAGHYIPICTRNAFLKAYTKYPRDNVYWSVDDKMAYLKDIENVYNYFVKDKCE